MLAARLQVLFGVTAALALGACTSGSSPPGGEAGAPPAPAPSESAAAAPAPEPPGAPEPEPAPPPERTKLTLIAGGDVSFGRMLGKQLIAKPDLDVFATMAPLLEAADVRFVNLESQLSDQKGETVSAHNPLVFTGPPEGAGALARASISIVSLANNHAWDYGKAALFETLDHLDRAGVAHVGAGRTREEAYRHVVVEREGFRLAFLAVTDIWNQGALSKHPGAEHVAGADAQKLADSIRALRADASIDAIAVSYHGGCEYMTEPITKTKDTLRAAIDAGADVVIGHHPHVVQGVEWRAGRPILYSLGNFLMRMKSGAPLTELGYLARIELSRGAPAKVEACPFRIHGITALRFVGDPLRSYYERQFFHHLDMSSRAVGGTVIAPPGDDGCASLSAPAPRGATVAAKTR